MVEKILTNFCGCLILIKQSGGDKKPRFSFFEKNAHHAIPIYANCMTGIFLMATQKFFQVILKICTKILFFFSTANRILYANKHFPKKSFCKQNFIFWVHNVVLDTIMLAFFFSIKIFSKTLKIPISFVWRVYVCLDQCLII